MTMTAQDRKYMELRDTLSIEETLVMDDVFKTLYQGCKYFDLQAAGDDRAASLEAALVRFFVESREA
jgi:hypothetical protein